MCVLTTGAYGNGLIQYLTTYRSNQIYTRSYATAWQSWKQMATAERPQEYVFPIHKQENWANVWPELSPGRYTKMQEGLVVLWLCIKHNDNEWFPKGVWTLGFLPVGFRPSKTISGTAAHFDGINFDDGGTFGSNGGIRVHVLPNGAVRLNHRGLVQIKQIEGTITFLAN